MRRLVDSISGDNLDPFHLWWRDIVLKREKVYESIQFYKEKQESEKVIKFYYGGQTARA